MNDFLRRRQDFLSRPITQGDLLEVIFCLFIGLLSGLFLSAFLMKMLEK